jgi:hypothetical protein
LPKPCVGELGPKTWFPRQLRWVLSKETYLMFAIFFFIPRFLGKKNFRRSLKEAFISMTPLEFL